jgi:hypothetical protein
VHKPLNLKTVLPHLQTLPIAGTASTVAVFAGTNATLTPR